MRRNILINNSKYNITSQKKKNLQFLKKTNNFKILKISNYPLLCKYYFATIFLKNVKIIYVLQTKFKILKI